MKKFIFITGLFLLFTGTSLFAQHTSRLITNQHRTDSTKVMIQALLNPSIQDFTTNNIKINTSYPFDYTNNKKLYYLNTFNSIMATFLLVKVSEIDMHDYPLMEFKLNGTRNVFQYNLMKRRTKFKYVSDLYKNIGGNSKLKWLI